MSVRILIGDVRERLRELPDESVHCVVTSPPYWGLRDYGTATWEGGDAGCDHRREDKAGTASSTLQGGKLNVHQNHEAHYRDTCHKCGARRVDSQLGLEATPEEHVRVMVEVFREVRRVMRRDATLWLNYGDCYANTGNQKQEDFRASKVGYGGKGRGHIGGQPEKAIPRGLKPKDLVGMPWSIAKALQAPYYTGRIRDERDRIWLAAMIDAEGCIFLHKRKTGQSNGQGYQRKHDSFGAGLEVSNVNRAIIDRCMEITGLGSICEQGPNQNYRRKQRIFRWNLRSNVCREVLREVYPHLVAKQHEARLAIGCPSSGDDAQMAHESLKALHNGGSATIDFPVPATMFEPGFYLRSDIIFAKPNPMPESCTDRPTKSYEHLFLLAKAERYYYDADAVREPQESASKSVFYTEETKGHFPRRGIEGTHSLRGRRPARLLNPAGRNLRDVWTIPTEPFPGAHFATFPQALVVPCIRAGCPEGGTVLDPFAGACTTLLVADKLGRNGIGIELNPEYAAMAERRIRDDCPLFAQVEVC